MEKSTASPSGDHTPSYRGYILAAILVGLVVISPMALIIPVENALWTYSRWSLGDKQVVQVRLEGTGSTQTCLLQGTEAGQAAEALLNASYCQSNRDGQGPQPKARLSFAFADGKTVDASMWPDGRFEISEMGGHYLIQAPSLVQIVQDQVSLQ